ncbi:MAG: hypothetical protein ACE5I3_06960 [Phycisphaerae bacterium]
MSHSQSSPALAAVIKIGGSVLTGMDAYARCAESLRTRLRAAPRAGLLVVVSAELGTTDRLEKLAQDLCPQPDPGTLDLLWSTGELQSAALLTLCLHRLGVAAVALNVHQCGLIAPGEAPGHADLRLNPLRLRYFLSGHPVVIVPGFLARGPFDSVVSLGRGASDLTAVLLASALNARRCELVKDVPGYFTADPRRDESARPIAWLSYDEALAMACAGCDLVQVAAIEAAQRTNTVLLIRSLAAADTRTTVSSDDIQEPRAADEFTALAVD